MALTLNLAYREFVGFEKALARQIEQFRRQHPDVEVRAQAFDVPELYERMIASGGCRSDQWDLFLALTDWLPQLMADGALTPLNDLLRTDPPESWSEGWSDSMLSLQRNTAGTVYALPYHDGPEMFMYRTDLFEDPGERQAFKARHGYDLGVPETWSQFRDMARFFTRPERDLYGCVVAAQPDGHNNVYDFMIHLWSRGGQLLDRRRPVFNGAEGQEALRFITDLINKDRVTQPAPREYESVKSGNYYASGRAAMMWNWCGFAAVAEIPELSKIMGKNRCALVPRGDGPKGRHMSLNIYWVLGIPAGSQNSRVAYSFLKSTASAAMDKITSLEGANGCRLSTWRNPDIRRQFQYYEIIEEVHRNVESPPGIPEYPQINETLSAAIDSVHTGQRTVKAALDEAARQVEQLLSVTAQPAR